MSRAASALFGVAAAYTLQSSVHNEPKRRFYEDEKDAVPVPGTVTVAESESLAPPSVVNGVTVRTSPSIEGVLRSARQSAYDAYTATHSYLHGQKEAVYEQERRVSSTMSSLHDRREDLLPNAIYVVIAALSGNIAARNRGFVARAVLPVGLGLGAFKYFLPQTFANTAAFVWSVEQKTVPELAQQQAQAVAKAQSLAHRVEESALSGQQKVHNSVERMRQRISKVTGLKIDEEVSKK